jgi:hypothetical protein
MTVVFANLDSCGRKSGRPAWHCETRALDTSGVARDVDPSHPCLRTIAHVRLVQSIEYSTILNVDASLRPRWQEILDTMAPFVISNDPLLLLWYFGWLVWTFFFPFFIFLYFLFFLGGPGH